MLNVDTSRARRTKPELQGLASAAAAAGDADEIEAVEWKRALDLNNTDDLVKVALWIIGVANRSPAGAASQFDGVAYLLLGVGDSGMATSWDEDRLRPKLDKYVDSAGPRYSFVNVDLVDGRIVLVVVAEPPRDGDRIHCLLKEASGVRAGTIYVRTGTRTHPATPSDLRRLQDRLLAGGARASADLELEAQSPVHIFHIDAGEEAVDAFVARRSSEVPQPVFGSPVAEFSKFMNHQSTAEEYAARLETYLGVLRSRARQHVLDELSMQESLKMALVVTNTSDTAAQEVRLTIEAPPHLSMFNVGASTQLPKVPDPHARHDVHAEHLDHLHPFLPGDLDVSIQRTSSSLQVQVQCGTIHAGESRSFAVPTLICDDPSKNAPVELKWRLTAVNRRGAALGAISAHLTSLRSIDELMGGGRRSAGS